MMLTKGQKQILNALIDKYERGTGYLHGKKPVQRIKMNLYNSGKSDFVFYDIEKSEIRNQYNSDVVDLFKEDLINFSWMDAEDGHIISEVWLPYEQLGRAYQALKRVPKGDIVDEVLLLLLEVQEKASSYWLNNYISDVYTTISRRKSKGSILPDDIQEITDLFDALLFAERLKDDEMLERVFSTRCFGNSKRFESTIKPRFIRILRKFLDDIDEDLNDEEVLKRVGIVKYPEQIEFCGNIQIKFVDGTVNYAPLRYGATVNSSDIKCGEIELYESIKRVLFIENRANYIDYVYYKKSDDELVIYHGGCFSPVKGLFFQKVISAAPPGTEFYHWGDIDYGGFSMLARLRRCLSSSIIAFHMSENELYQYREYITMVTDPYIKKLEQLIEKDELSDCKSCIEYMIMNRVRLEQEVMIMK